MSYFPILSKLKLTCSLILVLMTMPFFSYAQGKEDKLPESFFGEWVEDYAQCEFASILSIADSEGGLLVSGLDWYSTEVKVTNKDDVYTLTINGESEEGDFVTEINIKMGEEGTLIYSYPESDEIKLVKCNLEGDFGFEEAEMEEMEVVDEEFEVEEFNEVDTVSLENINIELLQGKWQSLEDEASYLVIEGDRMKNYYGGMEDELDNEMIMISDTCMNESDSANGLPEEKNRYLSNPNLDMCWYIEFVDTISLTLTHTATGNSLTYKRIE